MIVFTRGPKHDRDPEAEVSIVLEEVLYTARNATDLLQVVNFTHLLQVVNKLQQVC